MKLIDRYRFIAFQYGENAAYEWARSLPFSDMVRLSIEKKDYIRWQIKLELAGGPARQAVGRLNLN